MSCFLIIHSSVAIGQVVVVALTKMNVLYRGIDNPISIAVENYPCNRIVAVSKVGKLEKDTGCHYIFTDTSGAKEALIHVGVQEGDTVRWLSTYQFRIRNLPCPEITVADSRSRYHNKEVLLQNPELKLFYGESLFKVQKDQTILSWAVQLVRGDTVLYSSSGIEGGRFPNELIEVIRSAQANDRLIFSDITYSNPFHSCQLPEPFSISIL